MEFTKNELIEIKKSLNDMKAHRIVYRNTESINSRLKNNEEYIKLDEELIERFVKEIDKIKGVD